MRKRIPTPSKIFLWTVILVIGMGFTGCKKKDRLTTSKVSLAVIPPSVVVVKGDSINLTAAVQSPQGSSSASPEWSLSSSSLGSLNTTIGPLVNLTTAELGDLTVTATFDGLLATSRVIIVTYVPGKGTFDVYTDAGLPVHNGVTADIFLSPATVNITEVSDTFTPEGRLYFQTIVPTSGQAWGVTLDPGLTGLTRDMSSFSAGRLKFAIRLRRAISASPTEVISINVEDGNSVTAKVVLSSVVGFDSTGTDWQEISIPITSYGALSLAFIKVPFAVEVQTITSSLTFDIDAVRWEK